MSFDTNRLALMQEHFAVLEIDLPAFSSGQTCSLDGGTGFFTPLTCEEAWDTTTFKTYRFATDNTPLSYGRPPSSSGMPGDIIDLAGEPVHRNVRSLRERPTELQPGEGMAIKGTASITLRDLEFDPGPVEVTEAGTYFGKMAARNVLANKDARLIHYHVKTSGIYGESDGRAQYYLVDSLKNNGNGTWSLELRDELSRLDKDKSQFPLPTGGSVRAGFSDGATAIPVDADTDYSATGQAGSLPYVIKIGDELMKVTAVTNNLAPLAVLTVATRGADIVFTNTLSTTVASSHDVDDDVQICYTSDNEDIDDFLAVVLESSGIPSSVIPSADWAAEIAEWHPADKINTVWHEPVAANDVVTQVTVGFLLDIWFDLIDREVRLSAISVWQTSGSTATQGKEINRNSFRSAPRERLRSSRASVAFDKPNKVSNDDIESYRRGSVNIRLDLEAAGLYGEPKARRFRNSHVIGANAADLLTQRTTARYGETPEDSFWVTEEKFLNFKTGDILDIVTGEKQNMLGLPADIRAQVLRIETLFSTAKGRQYRVKALTYEPAFADGTEFVVSTNATDLNLHTFVGAPSQAVEVVIILDGVVISSSNFVTAALTVGGFAIGSKVILILKDSAEIQGGGGLGGFGGVSTQVIGFPVTNFDGSDGFDGGLCLSTGKDIDIHLGGTILGHTALGILKAPGGGGGGERGQGVALTSGGGGGGGGAGSVVGQGGPQGSSKRSGTESGVGSGDGAPGDTAGNGGAGAGGAGDGGDWGQPGGPSTVGSVGGAAGSGLDIFGIGVVNVFTDGNTGRFINGNGDAPDSLS